MPEQRLPHLSQVVARPVLGAGLGFRRELIETLQCGVPEAITFFELAPENWAGIGGRSARDLRQFAERYPFVCHGLSLSPGALRRLTAVCCARSAASWPNMA